MRVRSLPPTSLVRERYAVARPARDVLGHLDFTCSGLLGLGQLEGLADHLGDNPGGFHARLPFGERPQVLDDVDALVSFLVDSIAAGLPGDRDQGRAVEVRVGDAGREVRCAWPEGR